MLVSTLAGFVGHLFYTDAETMNWGKVFPEARVIGWSSTCSISNALEELDPVSFNMSKPIKPVELMRVN